MTNHRHHLPNIKQLPPTQATKQLMHTVNYHVCIQLTQFILTFLDLHKNFLQNQLFFPNASHSIGLSNIHHRQGKTILKVCQVSILFWSVTGIQWRLAAANQFCVCFLAQFPHMQSIVFDSSIQPKYFLTKHNAEISTGIVPIGVMFSISKSACKHHKWLLGSDYDLLSSFIYLISPLGLIKLTKYLLMISLLSHTA